MLLFANVSPIFDKMSLVVFVGVAGGRIIGVVKDNSLGLSTKFSPLTTIVLKQTAITIKLKMLKNRYLNQLPVD